MLDLNLRYVREGFDENGILNRFEIHCPEDFHFCYDIIDELAAHCPDKLAMLWVNSHGEERRLTFGELKRYSDRCANLLKSRGIKRGDKVMLILKRHYQFWFAMLGLHRIGAVAIPATNLLTTKDLIYRFNAASVKAVICTADGEIATRVEEALPGSPTVELKFLAAASPEGRRSKDRGGWLDFDRLLEESGEDFPPQRFPATEPMLLYFTSGTTGQPKMVLHNGTYPLGHIVTAKHWQNVQEDGLHLTLSETGWAKAVWGKLYGQWIMESAIFVYDFDQFVPSELMELFAKYRITSFCAPPTVFRFFIKEDLSKYDLSSLKYATIAGEALNPEVYNQFLSACGVRLMEGFGQTETTCLICNTTGMTPRPGSMGRPNPQYDVDIVDEDGNPVPPGVTGEIVVRTDRIPVGLFMGYYRDPELTAGVWHDGLYHTGDTAWKDEDGYYWYVGRLDDIIKSSGYRIGPFEIESVLMEHPAVLECAVIGVPDPIRGQVVKAVVVPARGYEGTEELKKELQEHVKRLTAPYKYPRVIEFTNALPKTISGKIKRSVLRKIPNNS